MKTTLIALLCLVASSLQANLIDLTPGGWDWNTQSGFPPGFLERVKAEAGNFISFFDEARTIPWTDEQGQMHDPDWVSRYGVLNGGTYFSTNLFTLDPTANAGVSWDFSALPGYGLGWLELSGRAANGDTWEHLYRVGGASRTQGSGTVTINGQVTIDSIAFYGRTPTSRVTETSATLLLFACGLAGLLTFHKITTSTNKLAPENQTKYYSPSDGQS
jgi:hypothetical protein